MTFYDEENDERAVYVVPTDAEQYVQNGSVSVIVEGNGIEWEPDAYVWLPDAVSVQLDEAGALELQFGEQQRAEYEDEDETKEVTVFVYTLT